MTEYKLPLRNRNKEIVDYCLVSQEDYEHLSKYYWNKTAGYVKGNVDKQNWLIHRYIMINILNYQIDSTVHIDHINGNPLDNRRENLRTATSKENNRNKKKVEDKTSKYFYVYYDDKYNNKWIANIKYNGKNLTAYYDNEKSAAYQVNLWIDEYNIPFVNKNEIEPPNDFVPYKPRPKKTELPSGIYLENNKYSVKFNYNKKYLNLGKFNTLDEAVECKANFFKQKEEEKEAEIMSRPITRDAEGNCVLQIKSKNEIINIIVDEEIYYDLIHYTWRISGNKYVAGRVNRQEVSLSRYVMNYDGKDFIDHINGNTLDNRKCNLRIATAKQNMMNLRSKPNASSKYIGVSYITKSKKWHSTITVNGKTIYLGCFDNEEDAARTRDIATKKYFGEFGRLNFPET